MCKGDVLYSEIFLDRKISDSCQYVSIIHAHTVHQANLSHAGITAWSSSKLNPWPNPVRCPHFLCHKVCSKLLQPSLLEMVDILQVQDWDRTVGGYIFIRRIYFFTLEFLHSLQSSKQWWTCIDTIYWFTNLFVAMGLEEFHCFECTFNSNRSTHSEPELCLYCIQQQTSIATSLTKKKRNFIAVIIIIIIKWLLF